LLVAALLMLRHPCTRNRITASLLLNRAAQNTALNPAEREACLILVDELECDVPSAPTGPAEKMRPNNGRPFDKAPAF
jgi:hypothetical protein